ncbi:hypothetical protein ACH4OW_18020 [Streptomyces sp. NPDC017056]|uniref:hypothetical protein n=1 Tax=Streptomyces sp. NPDC017056 TaxID=3364973 RepID=UPI0037AFD667
MTVQLWHRLHAKTQQYDGTAAAAPARLSRAPWSGSAWTGFPAAAERRRLCGCGVAGPPGHTPDPDLLWRAYTRRFDIEHTFRFVRQTLNWTLPRPRTPSQADRWT